VTSPLGRRDSFGHLGRCHRHQNTDDHEVEGDLHHRDRPGDLTHRVHVAVPDGPEGDDGVVERVGSRRQAVELSRHVPLDQVVAQREEHDHRIEDRQHTQQPRSGVGRPGHEVADLPADEPDQPGDPADEDDESSEV